MSLQDQIMEAMKTAMKARDAQSLEALRAVKSAILIARTETGSKTELTGAEEIKILQKQVKQRKDSAAIYTEQNRDDLAKPELEQARVIEQFLPQQMSEAEVAKIVDTIIAETGANTMKDMGRVMGLANAKLAGKADGKTISNVVRGRLAQ